MFKAWLFRAIVRVFSFLPLPLLYAGGVVSAILWAVGDKSRRKAVRANLGVLRAGRSPALLSPLLPFIHFHWTVCENLKLRALDPLWIRSHVRVRGFENVQRVQQQGRPAIFLSSHIGNWEIGARITALLGVPLSAIFLANPDAPLEEAYRARRSASGLEVFYAGRSAARLALNSLGKGKNVAAIFDFSATDRGMSVQWCGRDTRVARGAFWLAQTAGVCIVPTFCVRRGIGKFELIFDEPLEPGKTDFIQETVGRMERYHREFWSQWALFRPMVAQEIRAVYGG